MTFYAGAILGFLAGWLLCASFVIARGRPPGPPPPNSSVPPGAPAADGYRPGSLADPRD